VTHLRFPNPGSDIERLVGTFRLIARETQGKDSFDLDDMIGVVTAHGQASSQGAQGAMAVERSRREDRSRDALYNQLKMYSEIFRMLGWLRPLADQRLVFRVTLLGETLAFDAEGDRRYLRGLVSESLLAIVFPNTVTENAGVVNQRPFRWLLMLMSKLNGVITRHEVILGLLAVVDDQRPGELAAVVDRIVALRNGPVAGLHSAVDEFAVRQRVQKNTLENYTRLPMGVLASPFLGWGEKTRLFGLYVGQRPLSAVKLLPFGTTAAEELAHRHDIRVNALTSSSPAERALFASFSFYALLARAGLEPSEVRSPLAEAAHLSGSVLDRLDISWPVDDFLFSPFTQESDSVLGLASSDPR
jgi:hypothetical protein